MAIRFPNITRIAYESPKSKNPFAYQDYNPEEKIAVVGEGYRSPRCGSALKGWSIWGRGRR
jgi:hypothetical protein